MNAKELLQELKAEVARQTQEATRLLQENENWLNQAPGPGRWNALQCMAHLNSYAAHYLPAFEQSIQKSANKGYTFVPEIKSTWLGKKCIHTVLVTNSKKIKTPARHNHVTKTFDKKVVEVFLKNQQRLENILEKAGTINLAKTKTKIEIMPLLKLHLGDFLQFFIYHQTRHLAQAQRALQNATNPAIILNV